MIKAIIFDCFGVLITDSLQAMHDKLALTNPQGARELKAAVQLANRGIVSTDETREQLASLFGLDVDTYVLQLRQGEVRNEPLLKLITTLRPQYKTGLLSNIGAGSLHKRFSEAELAGLFDALVASGDVGVAKPDAAIYRLAANRLGVETSECIFVDDRVGFCEAAESTGMKAIVYESFEQFTADLDQLLIQYEK